jgi:hypothetical protein
MNFVAISAENSQHNMTIQINSFCPFGFLKISEIDGLSSDDLSFLNQSMIAILFKKLSEEDFESNYIKIYGLDKKTY